MPTSKQLHVVTFRIDLPIWKKFLKTCKNKDLSGSQVLRNYINLIVTQKLRIMDKKVYEYRKAAQPAPSDSPTPKP